MKHVRHIRCVVLEEKNFEACCFKEIWLQPCMIKANAGIGVWAEKFGAGGQANDSSKNYPIHEFNFPVVSLISANIARIMV